MNKQNLYNDCIRDLITDIKCDVRDNRVSDYTATCRARVAALFANRHGKNLDKWGMAIAG